MSATIVPFFRSSGQNTVDKKPIEDLHAEYSCAKDQISELHPRKENIRLDEYFHKQKEKGPLQKKDPVAHPQGNPYPNHHLEGRNPKSKDSMEQSLEETKKAKSLQRHENLKKIYQIRNHD